MTIIYLETWFICTDTHTHISKLLYFVILQNNTILEMRIKFKNAHTHFRWITEIVSIYIVLLNFKREFQKRLTAWIQTKSKNISQYAAVLMGHQSYFTQLIFSSFVILYSTSQIKMTYCEIVFQPDPPLLICGFTIKYTLLM